MGVQVQQWQKPAKRILFNGDVYDRTGLRILYRGFRFYGMRLDCPVDAGHGANGPRAVVRCHASLIVASSIFYTFYFLWLLVDQLLVPNIHLSTVLWFLNLLMYISRVLLTYGHTLLYIHKYQRFFKGLAECLDGIVPPVVQRSYARKVQRWTRVGVVLVCVLTAGETLLGFLREAERKDKMHIVQIDDVWIRLVNNVGSVFYILWLIFAHSFYCLYTVLVVVTCQALTVCFDGYLPDEPHWSEVSIGERLIRHQKLSSLVQEADGLFSNFTFMSLASEMVSLTIIYKTYEHGNLSSLMLMLMPYALTIITIMSFKVIHCSNLNDKVKESLSLKWATQPFVDIQKYSGVHVHYLLYQIEQIDHGAAITYGGLYAIKTSILFTIGGVILTYALVLKEF